MKIKAFCRRTQLSMTYHMRALQADNYYAFVFPFVTELQFVQAA